MKNINKSAINAIITILVIVFNSIFRNNKYILLFSSVVITIIVIIAVLDKNYKQNYNKYIPKWIPIITLACGLFLTILQFPELFRINILLNNFLMLLIGNVLTFLFLFISFKQLIEKFPSKKIMLIFLAIVISVIVLGSTIWLNFSSK